MSKYKTSLKALSGNKEGKSKNSSFLRKFTVGALESVTKTSIALDVSGSSDNESGVDSSSCVVSSDNGGSFSSGLTASSLSCGTSYSLIAQCSDYAGNYDNSSVVSISTSSCGNGGGGGGSGGSIVSGWVKELKLNQSEMNLGQALKTVKKNYRITFNVTGLGQHHVGVKNMTKNSATIEVASTPQLATLLIGETKKFNLNSDNYYDVMVKLVSIAGDNAKISLSLINERISGTEDTQANQPVTQSVTQNNPTETTDSNTVSDEAPETNEVDSGSLENDKNYNWVYYIVGLLVVVLIVISLTKNKKKR